VVSSATASILTSFDGRGLAVLGGLFWGESFFLAFTGVCEFGRTKGDLAFAR